MDNKVIHYKTLVKQLITDLGTKRATSRYPFIQYHTIIDDINGHYLLLRTGWQNSDRYYSNLIHIEVRDTGKVWLHEDRTDLIVADLLLDAKIPKNDIVLGFYSPFMRADTEFAIE